MPEDDRIRAGDNVTVKQLVQEHVRLIVEACDTLKEAAKKLGISARTLSRWLEKGIIYSVYPRRLRHLAGRGRARYLPPPDDAETGTDD